MNQSAVLSELVLTVSLVVACAALGAAPVVAQGAFLIDSYADNLYAVDHYTGAVALVGSTDNNGLATPVDLTWRRVTQELWTIDRLGGEIGTIDTETAAFTPVHATGLDGWDAIAWHEVDRCFYMTRSDDNLYRYTPWNAVLTLLGPTGYTRIDTLAVDADDELFGVAFAGPIVRLNTGTGAGVVVSSTTNFVTGLAIEPYSGRWYAIDASYETLERIDPATGGTTLMGSLSLNGFITLPRGLAFAERRDGGFAADRATGNLYYCDFATGTRHFLANVPHQVTGIAYDPKTGGLWVGESFGVPNFWTRIRRLDLSDGSWTNGNSVCNCSSNERNAIAFDQTTDHVFTVREDGVLLSGTPFPHGTMPLNTLGSTGLTDLRDLAFDGAGSLFGVRTNGDIFAIDKATATKVYLLGSVAGATGLAVEPGTGHFLVQAGGKLYEVDRATLVSTERGPLAGMGDSYLATFGHAPAYIIDSSTDLLGSVDLQTGEATAIGSTNSRGLTAPGDLTYRASAGELWTVDSDDGQVGFLDTSTGAFTPVFELGHDFAGIAWHEGDNRFYLGNRNNNIYALDLSGDVTLLGNTSMGEVESLDTDNAGNLVGITRSSGEVVLIDRVTGAGSLITATTITQFQDVGIDERTGDVYAVRSVDDALYSIDPATGASSVVGTFGSSFPMVRGFDLTDGYGASLARTLLIGTSCGGMSGFSQTPPRFSSDWELYLAAPQGTQFGGVAIGLQNPNLNLQVVGAPGCMLYTDMVDILWLQMPFGSPSHAIAVPPVVDLAGFELYAQAFGYAPNVNALGVVTSNGIYGRVGW